MRVDKSAAPPTQQPRVRSALFGPVRRILPPPCALIAVTIGFLDKGSSQEGLRERVTQNPLSNYLLSSALR